MFKKNFFLDNFKTLYSFNQKSLLIHRGINYAKHNLKKFKLPKCKSSKRQFLSKKKSYFKVFKRR